jgi:uncharacterized membrane protein YgdD (TMEM256/DUF423 family)
MLCFNPYCTVDDLSESKESYLLFSCFVILFSLSIYLLATNNLTFDFKVIGFVTPIGGTPTYSGLGRIIFPF